MTRDHTALWLAAGQPIRLHHFESTFRSALGESTDEIVVHVTGMRPTATNFVDPAHAPKK